MNLTPFSSPPGYAIRNYHPWISAADENYVVAVQKLLKAAIDLDAQNGWGANYIVQHYTQQTDTMTYTSGIIVRAEKV
jgi:hypothetical protein